MKKTTERQVAEDYAVMNRDFQLVKGAEFIKPYLKPGMTVLDVGCGTGDICAYMADIVGANGSIVGIDPDAGRIDIATEQWKHLDNVKFFNCKGSQMPIPKTYDHQYDLAISHYVFHWMDGEEKRQTLKNIFDSLRPSGIAVIKLDLSSFLDINTLTPYFNEQIAAARRKLHMPSEDLMRRLCKEAGFVVLTTKLYEDPVLVSIDELISFISATFGLDLSDVGKKLKEDNFGEGEKINLPHVAQDVVVQKQTT